MVSLTKLLNGGLLLGGNYFDVATPDQAAVEQYNIINFLGGAAPYKQFSGYGISTAIPQQCKVQQVQLYGRHGERFPTKGSGKEFEALVTYLKEANVNGSLAFINDYEYFVTDHANYDMETTEANSDSIYIGSESARRDGVQFRLKYGSLYNETLKLPVFTSNSHRCYDTSQNFAQAFLGSDFSPEKIITSVIDEDASAGANSLTPRSSCSNYNGDFDNSGLDKYFNATIKRLQQDNQNLNLTVDQVTSMFDICAYEINVKGYSPFCELFTLDDFVKNEYYNDVDLYYTQGAGNNLTSTIGSVILKASHKLLTDPPQTDDTNNKIWLSFTHDSDIVNIYTALGIFNDSALPRDRIAFGNKFNKAKIIPQSTRVILEKYQCDETEYVRFIINDSVVPLVCHDGPGFGCALDDYTALIQDTIDADFNSQCGTNGANEISFYWDYTDVHYNASLIQS